MLQGSVLGGVAYFHKLYEGPISGSRILGLRALGFFGVKKPNLKPQPGSLITKP